MVTMFPSFGDTDLGDAEDQTNEWDETSMSSKRVCLHLHFFE